MKSVGTAGLAQSASGESTAVKGPLSVLVVALVAGLAVAADASMVVNLGLVVGGMVVLSLPPNGTRFGLARAPRALLLLSLVVALLVVSAKSDFSRLAAGKVRVWNVFHYYLGAKYFPELGYADLYRASLSADEQGHGYWSKKVTKLRDLETYEIKRRASIDRYQFTDWSAERKLQFERDLNGLKGHRSRSGWRNTFRDRGYNGTPLWTTMGRTMTAWVPTDSKWLLLLCSLDLVLLAGTWWLVATTFGARTALVMALLFVASPTNVARLVGGFLQVDWLCALIASVCFFERRKSVVAGGLMAYAITTRVFPLLFLVGVALPVLRKLIAGKSLSRSTLSSSRGLRYMIATAAFCLVGLVIGALGNGRGLSGWMEFSKAITVHREVHAIGDRRVGLKHAFGHSSLMSFTETKDDDRRHLLAERQPWIRAAQAFLLLLFVLAAWRSTASTAQILAVAAMFGLFVLSRYYFAILVLLPLLRTNRGRVPFVVRGQLLIFAAYWLLQSGGVSMHVSYVWLNALLLVYLTFVVLWVGCGSLIRKAPVNARGQPVLAAF